MNFKDIIKPATVTSAGLIIYFASFIIDTPPSVLKAGAILVVAGSIWFFLKK